MKFDTGDCLSFNVNNTFFAGLINSTSRGKYEIALCDFNYSQLPTADYFKDCQLFSTKFEMGETSVSSLDTITMDPVWIDRLAVVEKITHIDIPGFIAASGFQEITNLNELRNYFYSGMDLRNGKTKQRNTPTAGFEIKCLISITEFLKNIPPRNEFPTVKLYKNVDHTIHYFQIYGSSSDPLFLVIHWGKLGENGQFNEIKDKTLDDIREMYKTEIAKVQSQGYEESKEYKPMVLQFQADDKWGGLEDLDFRNKIWDYLDRFLFWTGNGSISGGDIGSGTVNLFFETISPELAIKTIVNALVQKKVERPYLIALEGIESEKGITDVKVLYPENYNGKFFY